MSKKQKLNLIEELTTHKCDFQIWPFERVEPKPDVRPRAEPASKEPPPFVPIDPQSHASYRPSAHVPFDLYVERKPIVRTVPGETFVPVKNIERPTSKKKHTSLNTTLSPAVPMDAIKEESDLQMILRHTYTCMHRVLMEEAALKNSKTPNPPNKIVNEGNDLTFRPQLYPPLPPGWIAAANHWDCLQSRQLGDPTRNFWMRKGPEVECSCCCNPLPKMLSTETKDQIRQLVEDDNLRLPYDITKTGYQGYRHVCAKGVPLEKSNKT